MWVTSGRARRGLQVAEELGGRDLPISPRRRATTNAGGTAGELAIPNSQEPGRERGRQT